MKKLLIALTFISGAFTFTACSSDDDNSTPSNNEPAINIVSNQINKTFRSSGFGNGVGMVSTFTGSNEYGFNVGYTNAVCIGNLYNRNGVIGDDFLESIQFGESLISNLWTSRDNEVSYQITDYVPTTDPISGIIIFKAKITFDGNFDLMDAFDVVQENVHFTGTVYVK